MRARLQDKLPRIFLLPLVLGILFSIVVTIIYLVFYARYLTMSDEIRQFIRNADIEKSEPILYNLQNLIYRSIQGSIDTLMGIKQYYRFLIESGNFDLNNIEKMKKFINKYSFNAVEAYYNYEQVISNLTKNNNETYLDYGIWYYNPTKTTLDSLDDLTIKQIYILNNMILLLRSNYEINRETPSKGFKIVYVGFSNSNLFYSYPVMNNLRDDLYPHVSMQNEPWCRDERMSVPTYYYVKCRPWFQESQNFFNNYNLSVSITIPYSIEIVNDKSGITICIRVDDLINSQLHGSNSNVNQFMVICIDQLINTLLSAFDEFNNLLSGYFFMMRIKSDIPMYYPRIMDKKYITNIFQYEFQLNTTFYMNEIKDYTTSMQKFTANMNSTEDMKFFNTSGHFFRNNFQENYQIYPVILNIDDDPSKTQHMMSIIYITNADALLTIVKNFNNKLLPNLGVQIVILIILGSILFLICRYLLISIAINIVRPIKLMKRLIEGMNNRKICLISDSEIFRKDYEKVDEGDSEDLLEKRESSKNSKNKINKANDYSKKIELNNNSELVSFNNLDDDDYEDYIGTRSKDIENLFNKLINLKKVVSFTQDTSLNIENESILNFLFARHTFKEVNNLKAKFLCDSNVGNLAIKCKKYDKAIFHLLESLNDPANDFEMIQHHVRFSKIIAKKNYKSSMINPKNLPARIQKSFISTFGKNTVNTNFDINEIGSFIEKSQQKVEIFKKKFLDSRYPKLLYAYRKYYKNLKKIIKSPILWQSLTHQDLYTLYEKHSLAQYENIIIEYCRLSSDYLEDKKYVEALLEYNEFLINFKLKPQISEISDVILIPKGDDLKLHKTEVIKNIKENFRKIDIKMIKLKKSVTNEYLKNILDMINVLKKDSIEMIEIPIQVLNQKSNYLKGKFLFYCDNYSQAYLFFNESRKINIISNAQLIRSSLKKIKKILNIFSETIESGVSDNYRKNMPIFPTQSNINIINSSSKNLLVENSENKGSKKSNYLVSSQYQLNSKIMSMPKIEKLDKLNKFNYIIDEFIFKYQTFPKDIAILINCSNAMNNDHKKSTISLKTALNIFENYTTSEDRFCVFSYSCNSNPLINLSFKNINTIDYIKYQLENYMNKEEIVFQEESSSLIKTISSVYDYLEKKNYCSNKNREKWIISVTDEISEEDINYIKNNDLHEKLFFGSKYDSLVIIFISKLSSELENVKNFINFNKSCMIDLEKMDVLKKNMRIRGVLNDYDSFAQEKYEKSVKNI